VAAALAIVDGDGLPALNMRRLGAALGVEAMSVYRHFPNKDAVLDGVVQAVLAELPETPPGEDWRTGYRETFITARSLLRAHLNALPLVASRPLASPQLKNRLQSTRDLLLLSGLAEDDVLHLLHAGLGLTLGYLWLEAGGFVGELPYSEPFLRTRSAGSANPDEAPDLTGGWSREKDFAAGLTLLLSEPKAMGTG